ncbi:hypothetical protein CEP52_009254 [Fusarium oligoseptatum]|uniref:Uncharacterized protein n=1 Tax=Fusarium oligoseptatum TaxID=2604345 RepID=A0A428TDR9_9HYPO|nr:hypothetical protein CEP52_009254 [Fusarium oligoseptatum]
MAWHYLSTRPDQTLQNEAPNGPQETFKPSMPEGLKDQGRSSHLPGRPSPDHR